MKKIIAIEGMHCEHCQARVQKALDEIPGIKAKVDLKKKQAIVEMDNEVPGHVLKNAVSEAGYEAVSVTEKKGLFGN